MVRAVQMQRKSTGFWARQQVPKKHLPLYPLQRCQALFVVVAEIQTMFGTVHQPKADQPLWHQKKFLVS